MDMQSCVENEFNCNTWLVIYQTAKYACLDIVWVIEAQEDINPSFHNKKIGRQNIDTFNSLIPFKTPFYESTRSISIGNFYYSGEQIIPNLSVISRDPVSFNVMWNSIVKTWTEYDVSGPS